MEQLNNKECRVADPSYQMWPGLPGPACRNDALVFGAALASSGQMSLQLIIRKSVQLTQPPHFLESLGPLFFCHLFYFSFKLSLLLLQFVECAHIVVPY